MSAAWTERVRTVYAGGLGEAATVEEGFGPVGVDVPSDRWVEALALAKDGLGCTYFDWLSAVDELGEGFRIVCHLAAHRPGSIDHLVVRTLIARAGAAVASVAGLFAGARWHERETHEMFGVDFTEAGRPLALETLLLPDEFEGHPLRKEFVLASRVAKPWPGAKEPGESDHDAAPARRRARAAGSPEAEQWGPREPGSEAPDPLAAATPAPARPRRAPREPREPRQPPAPGGTDD